MFKANTVICVLSPEISLKSNKVRVRLESIVKENILKYLKANKIDFLDVYTKSARIFIKTSETKKTRNILRNCFGIFSLIEAQKTDELELDALKKIAVEISKNRIGESFAVRAKSHNKKLKSKEIEIEIGASIMENFSTKVNLSSPATQLNVLLFEDKTFFYFDSISGAKGMPVGAQGTICLIGKNKKDSEKLTKKLLKCGCRVKLIADFDLLLKEFNAMDAIQKIDSSELEKLRKNKRIEAIFSDTTNPEEKYKTDNSLNEKTFAPLLCLSGN